MSDDTLRPGEMPLSLIKLLTTPLVDMPDNVRISIDVDPATGERRMVITQTDISVDPNVTVEVVNEGDDTGWTAEFGFSAYEALEGWTIEHGQIVPGKGIRSAPAPNESDTP